MNCNTILPYQAKQSLAVSLAVLRHAVKNKGIIELTGHHAMLFYVLSMGLSEAKGSIKAYKERKYNKAAALGTLSCALTAISAFAFIKRWNTVYASALKYGFLDNFLK